jgi:hypothetical protein
VDVEIAQPMNDARPAVAAVGAPEDPVDLHAGPDRAPVVGVDEHAGDERRPDRALSCDRHIESLPLQSAVARTIDPGRPRPREERAGVGRIDGQRPDRRHFPRGANPLPGRAAVVAPEQSGVSGSQDIAGLARDDDQRLDPAIQGKRRAMTDP